MISVSKIVRLYPQALAAFAVWVLMMQIGIFCVWSSPYLTKLTAPTSPLPLTLSEASWVVSLLYVGRIIGTILGSVSLSIFGSRKTTLLAATPMALGWILMILADSPIGLCAARITLGVGFGFLYSCYNIYLGEIAAADIRGTLVSFAICGGPVGDLLASITGSYLSLFSSSIAYLVPCVALIILLCFLPDTPHHLVKIGNFEAAKKSIQWYRGSNEVDSELEEIIKFVNRANDTTFMDQLAQFKQRHVRRATFLVMMLFVFLQCCGFNTILFYMETILVRSKFNLINPSSAVSYALFTSIVSALLTIGLYDRCGRRILLILSSIGASISLCALGTHFFLLQSGFEWPGSQWLPLLSIFFFIVTFVFGLNSIPGIVSSEVYPASVKSIANCMSNLVTAFTALMVTKSYQPLVDEFGEAYVFFGYAVITAMAVPYAIFCMPETKGKSLLQIQEVLMKKK